MTSPKRTITDNTHVTLTLDPYGDFPVTLEPERFDVVCDAISLHGLARKVGQTRLSWQDDWTFTIGDDGYRMQVA